MEFTDQGIPFQREQELPVDYKGRRLPCKYRADFICYESIIVELKALQALTGVEEAQLLNYLKPTQLERGLLLNFGRPSLEFKRLVFANLRKSGASVKLSLSCDLKGGHHGMTRLPCSPTGMPEGNRAV
jgi:GxxExxY protein